MKEKTKLLIIIMIFLACYFVPWGSPTIRRSGFEALMMLRDKRQTLPQRRHGNIPL